MVHRQHQQQLPAHQQSGIGQQPQFHQSGFQPQPPSDIGAQWSQPATRQGAVPQQPPTQAWSAAPQEHGATQQPQIGIGQQPPQAQQPPQSQQLPQTQQSPASPPAAVERQQRGQFDRGLPGQTGGFDTQQQLRPQPAGQRSMQQMTAPTQRPPQTQFGAMAPGQSAGFGTPQSGPATSQSLQPQTQSLSPQLQEMSGGSVPQSEERPERGLTGQPSIDVLDTPESLVLFVDLPGTDEENIRIQADGQNLTISAQRREEEQEEGQKFTRERPLKLQRTIRLPARANVDEADATYEDGVCKITLPKMEEEKQHEIAFQ